MPTFEAQQPFKTLDEVIAEVRRQNPDQLLLVMSTGDTEARAIAFHLTPEFMGLAVMPAIDGILAQQFPIAEPQRPRDRRSRRR